MVHDMRQSSFTRGCECLSGILSGAYIIYTTAIHLHAASAMVTTTSSVDVDDEGSHDSPHPVLTTVIMAPITGPSIVVNGCYHLQYPSNHDDDEPPVAAAIPSPSVDGPHNRPSDG